MRRLRDYGIYTLPGVERSLFALPAGEGSYLLYDCERMAGDDARVKARAEVCRCCAESCRRMAKAVAAYS